MTSIASIGWGSLIWDKSRPFPVHGEWKADGPLLPVEFARQSSDGHVTLVLSPGVPAVQTCWAILGVGNLEEAAEALRVREGTTRTNIGCWPGGSLDEASAIIGPWAEAHELAGVVWTALPPKWNDTNGRFPSEEELLDYLSSLTGPLRQKAEQYVRCAPAAIRTPYRAAIEAALGWFPSDAAP